MNAKSFIIILVVLVALLAIVYFFRPNDTANQEWAEYLGGPDRNHYSTLTQIDSSNVGKLAKA
ncbi:MAG TPA: hypothetical protein VFI14_04560, partial [Chryseosolibacter sp.]|nr:hypothetical protein [Chryseosolibacter sp.]